MELKLFCDPLKRKNDLETLSRIGGWKSVSDMLKEIGDFVNKRIPKDDCSE